MSQKELFTYIISAIHFFGHGGIILLGRANVFNWIACICGGVVFIGMPIEYLINRKKKGL